MSEYQYFEFRAVDRPLTDREMRTLRSVSTRARITPTSFVNEYDWGDFKGDPDAWMRRYFDGYLHVANWGTHALSLRLPEALLPRKTIRPYGRGGVLTVKASGPHVILAFVSEDDAGDFEEEPEALLSTLLALRDELGGGDHRALYLGWLAGVQAGVLDDNEAEPPCPAGLGDLTPALEALASFLRLGPDLLTAAARGSAPIAPLPRAGLRRFIAALPAADKTDLLVRCADGRAVQVGAELRQRFRASRSDPRQGKKPRRTVGTLRTEAARQPRGGRQPAARR